jgi:UDP-glucose 4-epimerase
MIILVTGGVGYIGSHTCVELLQAGHEIVVVDNLCNSNVKTLVSIDAITGKTPAFVEGDIRNRALLDSIFLEYQIDLVIHFAGLKAVGESVEKPLMYYNNNVYGTLVLTEAMQAAGIKHIIFSSSATVYGDPESVPIRESFPLSAINPYGRSKLFIEEMLYDLYRADPEWEVVILRYFNPVGAHKSGLIGENPNGIPNNLMPYISQVAAGKLEKLSIFGGDYLTRDGTGMRDYIHVVDLAKGHLTAVNNAKLAMSNSKSNVLIVNLGTGQGYTVLEMVKAFEQASGQKIAYEITARREGDVAECFTDPSYAKQSLNWQAEISLEQMCKDVWNFQLGLEC